MTKGKMHTLISANYNKLFDIVMPNILTGQVQDIEWRQVKVTGPGDPNDKQTNSHFD